MTKKIITKMTGRVVTICPPPKAIRQIMGVVRTIKKSKVDRDEYYLLFKLILIFFHKLTLNRFFPMGVWGMGGGPDSGVRCSTIKFYSS